MVLLRRMSSMNIEIPLLALLAASATSLSARVAMQGLEQALFTTVIEYWLRVKRKNDQAHFSS